MNMRGLAAVALFTAFLSPVAAEAGVYKDGTYKWWYSTYKNDDGQIVAQITGVERQDGDRITGPLAIPATVTRVATLELGYEKWNDERDRYVWNSTRAPKVEMQNLPVEAVSGISAKGVTALSFPDTVKSIWNVMDGYEYGWDDCECDDEEDGDDRSVKLVSVSLPAGLEDIGNSFNSCSNLAEVVFNGADIDVSRSFRNTAWARAQGDFVVVNGSLIAYQGTGTSAVVPEGVAVIGSSAFDTDYNADATNLVSVTLPKGLEEISSDAFSGCENLQAIDIPRGVWFIGSYAFAWTGLTAVNLPTTLQALGSSAFYRTPLASLTVPEGLTSLGGVCSGCTNLTSVSLPSTARYLVSAFSGCGKLASVALPAGVKYMYNAFYNCTNLTSVALPERVKNLDWAFQNCYNLTGIDIPASVKSLYYTFQNCTNLVSVTGGAGLQSVTDPFGYAWSVSEKDPATGNWVSKRKTGVPFYDNAADGFRMLGPVVYGYKGALPEDLVYPAGARFVMYSSLDGATNGTSVVKSVTYPDSVEVAAVAYMWNLNTVNLGAGVTNLTYNSFPSTVSNVTGGTALRLGAGVLANTAWAQNLLKNCGTNAVPFDFVRLGTVALGYVGQVPANLVIPDDLTQVYGGFNYYRDPAVSNVVSIAGGASLQSLPYMGYFENLATIDMPGTRITYYDGAYVTNLVSVKLGVDPERLAEMVDEDEYYGLVSSDAFEGCDKLASVEFVTPGFKIVDWKARFYENDGEDLLFQETFPDDVSTFRYVGYRTDLEDEECSYFTLVPTVRRSLSTGVAAEPFDGSVASVYNGFLYGADGKFVGTFTAKIGKANAKTGLAKATVQLVPIGGKKISLRGEVDANGVGQGNLAGLFFTKNGVYGSVSGFTLDGSLDLSKDRKSELAQALKALKGKAWGVVLEPEEAALDMIDSEFALSVVMGTSGKAKVAGILPSGTKVSVNSVAVASGDLLALPVVFSKRTDNFGFIFWIDTKGETVAVTDVANWTGTLAATKEAFDEKLSVVTFDEVSEISAPVFMMSRSDLPATLQDSFIDMLPLAETFEIKAGRWAFAKNAMVKYAKGVFDQAAYDKGVAAGKTNASQLKLTYQKRDGSFKGSFKLYADNGKGGLKRTTVSVFGVVINGRGHGMAFVKKLGSFQVHVGFELDNDDE